MRKAISEVVSTILLLLIAVAMSGAAWTFIDNYYDLTAVEPPNVFACGPSPPPTWSEQDIPLPFRNMMAYEPTGSAKTYYIAIKEPGASNENDGLSPVYEGGTRGPWLDFGGPVGPVGTSFSVGDALAVREGTYLVGLDGITFSPAATEAQPFKMYAYNGEKVILDGGYRPEDFCGVVTNWANYAEEEVLAFRGEYGIFEGFTLQGCYVSCAKLSGKNIIFKDNTVIGSLEEGIKAIIGSKDVLIIGNEFFEFANEAIDDFGSEDLSIIGNEFHDGVHLVEECNGQPYDRGIGTPLWTKAGTERVSVIGNTFRDLNVNQHALIVGGCCWNNWGGQAGVDPVAREVKAIRNTFQNITLMSTLDERGVVASEGCHDCEISGNLIEDADDGIGVRATIDDQNKVVETKNLVVRDNTLAGIRTGRLYNIREESAVGLAVQGNAFYLGGKESVRYGDDIMTFNDFQALGYDAGSLICPLAG